MKPSQKLKKLRTLLSRPSRWGKRFYARTKKGQPCNVSDHNAYCFCVSGALAKIEMADKVWDVPAEPYLKKTIPKKRTRDIVTYNDRSRTTHRHIMLWVDRAIKMALKDEATARSGTPHPH